MTDYEQGYYDGRETGYEMRDMLIIRCKDCKYFVSPKGYYNQGSPQCSKLDTIAGWISEDSYCSLAERKDKK